MAHSTLATLLGAYITEERKHKNINQANFAKKLGCSAQFLGRFEKGEVMLPQRLVRRAVKALSLNPSRLKSIHTKACESEFHELFGIKKS